MPDSAPANSAAFTIRCDLVAADYVAFRRHFLFRYRKIHWIYGGILGAMLLFVWFSDKLDETLADRIYGIVGLLFVWGILAVIIFGLFRIVSRFTRSRINGPVGEHVFEFSADGITESNVNGRVETRRIGIRSVDETARHFFVFTTSGTGHIIPKRDLKNLGALQEWRRQIQ